MTEPSLSALVSELKMEGREFLQTRIVILKKELGTKVNLVKMAAALFAIALVLFVAGFLAITGLFVTLIANAFADAAGWMWAFLIVGGAYFIIAGVCAAVAWGKLKQGALLPRRTLEVLKQDQKWLRDEANSQAA